MAFPIALKCSEITMQGGYTLQTSNKVLTIWWRTSFKNFVEYIANKIVSRVQNYTACTNIKGFNTKDNMPKRRKAKHEQVVISVGQ
jgi:hypothetical protein